MKILLVAPQPFYQQRGTPIAVRLLVRTLCEAGHDVDLLTYHEGEDVKARRLKIIRIAPPAFISDIPIGLSWKKIICDGYITLKMVYLLKRQHYDVVHAVEEAIFPALLLKRIFGFVLIYDMDSSLVEQLVDNYSIIKVMSGFLQSVERLVVKGADMVLPVCKTLSIRVNAYAPHQKQLILHDVPILSEHKHSADVENLKTNLKINGPMALYVGNLEPYQGIGLLLEALVILKTTQNLQLVVIGGDENKIKQYQLKAEAKGVKGLVHFIGPRPLNDLMGYLSQADILVSPRSIGQHTPMKLYSYLASGRPILATNISSHNQIVDASCALLVKPEPHAIAAGLSKLIGDTDLCQRIGIAGKQLVRERYSRTEYSKTLLKAYSIITKKV